MPRFREVAPYRALAAAYDAALGRPWFAGVRRALDALVRLYGIRFSTAADLGCGTGLLAAHLSRRWGVPVIGVDLSPAMLRVARENCRGERVVLLRQDLRALRLPWPVDLATCTFDTLNHLLAEDDLRRAFLAVHANLRPGGHLIFDVITPCGPLEGRRRTVRRLGPPGRRIVQSIRWEPGRNRLTVVVLARTRLGPAPFVERHVERAWRPVEVGRSLLDAGFVIRGVHDASTLRPADRCPARILVVARKSPAGR